MKILRLLTTVRKPISSKILNPQLTVLRFHGTDRDQANTMCGNREYVGFGVNGSPTYADMYDFPIPAIRFREPDDAICALREKEKGDWKSLSKEEVKTLYRYSFCQTLSECKAYTGEWKLHVGITLIGFAAAIAFTIALNIYHMDLPPSYSEDSRQAQLKRMIALEVGPITGLSSRWDYEVGDWKS